MKRYIFLLVCTVLFGVCANDKQVAAYTITMEENSIYVDSVPDYIKDNVVGMCRKQINKSIKYYEKYKDADTYTYNKKVPDKYRDFIEKAKEIKDSDELTISHPFYIYAPGEEELYYRYYFRVKKNQENWCIICVYVYRDTGDTELFYDESMDRYSKLNDDDIASEAIFYQVGRVIYAETLEKQSIVRELPQTGIEMLGDTKNTEGEKFHKKEYEEKKTEILEYLDKVKNGKVMEESKENIKLELKEEYVESEEEKEEGEKKGGIYIVIPLCLLAVAVLFWVGKRYRQYRKRTTDF